MTSQRAALIALSATAALLFSGCGGPTPAGPSSSTPSTPAVPLISIDSPAADATTVTPVELSGTADTFEAALTVDALDASGSSLCVRNITATSGSGTPGTWATTLAFPPPDAAAPVTIRAYSFSAADGAIENLVERTVTVSTERPPIFITSPGCGEVVAPGSTLTVSGRAFVFEAALTLQLRDAAGTAVVELQVMAARGDEESPWSVALAVPAGLTPGAYDLVAYDLSARDGTIENEFSIQILVQP